MINKYRFKKAAPAKLDNGKWGVRLISNYRNPFEVSDIVEVITSPNTSTGVPKIWFARITKIYDDKYGQKASTSRVSNYEIDAFERSEELKMIIKEHNII